MKSLLCVSGQEACSAVDISLPPSGRSCFLSLFASPPSSSCLPDVFFSLRSAYLSPPQTVCLLFWALVCASPCTPPPKASYIVTWPGNGQCLSRCSLSSDVVYSAGAHSCISRQGWLKSSFPQALKVERDMVWSSRRGGGKREWRAVGIRKWRNEGSKMMKKGKER